MLSRKGMIFASRFSRDSSRRFVRPAALVGAALCATACTTFTASGYDPTPDPEDPPDFHAYAWEELPVETEHITHMVVFWNRHTPERVAQWSQTRPPGRSYLLSRQRYRDLLGRTADICRTPSGQPTSHFGVWCDNGIEVVANNYRTFFERFVAAGGRCDGLILDFEVGNDYHNPEELGWHSWGIGTSWNDRWEAIQDDPRFPALAEELGFSDLQTVANWRSSDNYLLWNSVMSRRMDEAIQRAIFDVVHEFFPDAECSNWRARIVTRENVIPNKNGHLAYRETPGLGTHDADAFYSFVGQLRDVRLDGSNRYGLSPFAGFLLDVNSLRANRRSTDRPMHAWIATYAWQARRPEHVASPAQRSPYYDERIYHLGLSGVDTYLFWNPEGEHEPNDLNRPEDVRRLDALLEELESRLAQRTGEPITFAHIPWGEKVVATGVQVGNQVLWRFSFAEGVDRIQVQVNGQTREINAEPGRRGAWFSHPVGAELEMLPEAHGPVYEIVSDSGSDPRDDVLRRPAISLTTSGRTKTHQLTGSRNRRGHRRRLSD